MTDRGDLRDDGSVITPPPVRVALDDGSELRVLVPDDAGAVAAAVGTNLDHLRPWMPWANDRSADPAFQRARIRGLAALAASGSEWQYGLFADGDFLGSFGLMTRRGPGILEIGYWLCADATGTGRATRAASALADIGAAADGIDELWIVCDEANLRSAAVALRCGFELLRSYADVAEAPGEAGTKLVFVRDVR